MVTDITSFGKHLERSSGHTLSFYPNVSVEISQQVFYGDLVYKLRRVKCQANFLTSDSRIVKRKTKYDSVIIERTIGFVRSPSTALYRYFLKHCTLTKTCPNLLRGDKALILVPSDCYLGLFQSFDLRSISDGRSLVKSCHRLYAFLIYCFDHRTCLCNNFYGCKALKPKPLNAIIFIYIKRSVRLFDSDYFDTHIAP